MRVRSMINVLIDLYNNKFIINALEKEYPDFTLRCSPTIDGSYTIPWKKPLSDFSIKIGNFVFYPCGTCQFNSINRGMTIFVLNEKGDYLEVYGIVKDTPAHPIWGGWGIHRSLKFGWKVKGPWVNDIEETIKSLKKDIQLLKAMHAEYSLKTTRQCKLDEKNKKKQLIADFSKHYK